MNLLTTQELANAVGINYENCKYRLRTLGIEPTRKIGRSNLYDERFATLLTGDVPEASTKRIASPTEPQHTVVIARSYRHGQNWLRDHQLDPSRADVRVISSMEEVQRLQGCPRTSK